MDARAWLSFADGRFPGLIADIDSQTLIFLDASALGGCGVRIGETILEECLAGLKFE